MNKFANIALTALVATTALVSTARGAQAGGACDPAGTLYAMEVSIVTGSTAQQGFDNAVAKGFATNSTSCVSKVRNYVRTPYLNQLFPNAYAALN